MGYVTLGYIATIILSIGIVIYSCYLFREEIMAWWRRKRLGENK